MPIPTPSGRESESAYISKCMDAIGDEYKDKDQALAVCYTQWRESKGLSSQKSVNQKIADIGRKQELIEPNPCQEGYIAIGLKPKGGRMVPNCVPEE